MFLQHGFQRSLGTSRIRPQVCVISRSRGINISVRAGVVHVVLERPIPEREVREGRGAEGVRIAFVHHPPTGKVAGSNVGVCPGIVSESRGDIGLHDRPCSGRAARQRNLNPHRCAGRIAPRPPVHAIRRVRTCCKHTAVVVVQHLQPRIGPALAGFTGVAERPDVDVASVRRGLIGIGLCRVTQVYAWAMFRVRDPCAVRVCSRNASRMKIHIRGIGEKRVRVHAVPPPSRLLKFVHVRVAVNNGVPQDVVVTVGNLVVESRAAGDHAIAHRQDA
ncbi:MAG: hypothetical protein BWY59_00973 [Verrucomicrobia bacterium ADurb.Bin345]|nr:MAG: hypothetical protein BWY59_00973 [Verrucomicrobia bacterium ADurb.Bin345]